MGMISMNFSNLVKTEIPFNNNYQNNMFIIFEIYKWQLNGQI